MKEADVILAAFRQADGKVKNRPAIVLRVMPPFGDLLVCGVSSQIRQQVSNFDVLISPGDSDYRTSGLACESLVAVIGSISRQKHEMLLRRLSEYLLAGIPKQR